MADGPEAGRIKGEKFVSANQPAAVPYYALRELLAGRVQIICQAHNMLLAAENPAEALLAMSNRNPAEGRTKQSRMQDLMVALERVFEKNPKGGRQDLKREALQSLAIQASRMWRKAHRLRSTNLTQSLACFNDGKISHDDAGGLRLKGTEDSFNCITSERCAAAAYLYENKAVLDKLINALHPNNLDVKIANKNETKQRKKALKELKSIGPNRFHKGRCRALGDAYFAAMCPPGSIVLTTNIEDFAPLCLAINKEVKEP